MLCVELAETPFAGRRIPGADECLHCSAQRSRVGGLSPGALLVFKRLLQFWGRCVGRVSVPSGVETQPAVACGLEPGEGVGGSAGLAHGDPSSLGSGTELV